MPSFIEQEQKAFDETEIGNVCRAVLTEAEGKMLKNALYASHLRLLEYLRERVEEIPTTYIGELNTKAKVLSLLSEVRK